MMLLFFFSSRRRHTRYWRDWSSDVCSSDLAVPTGDDGPTGEVDGGRRVVHGQRGLRQGLIEGPVGRRAADGEPPGVRLRHGEHVQRDVALASNLGGFGELRDGDRPGIDLADRKA